jgi:hypothetical protein
LAVVDGVDWITIPVPAGLDINKVAVRGGIPVRVVIVVVFLSP